MQIKIYVVYTELFKIPYFNNSFENTDLKLKRKLLNDTKRQLIKLFGGLTESRNSNIGYWENQNQQIEKDSVKIWEILTDSETFNKNADTFRTIIHQIKQITQQKSQLYTLNPSVKPIFT